MDKDFQITDIGVKRETAGVRSESVINSLEP
jgi:hypothetical protein